MQKPSSNSNCSKGKTPAVTAYEQRTQAQPLGFIPSKLIPDSAADAMVYNEPELLPVSGAYKERLTAALEKLHNPPITALGVRVTRLSGSDVGPREEFIARHEVRLSFYCACPAESGDALGERHMHGIETWQNSVANVEGAVFKEEKCRIDAVGNMIKELERRVRVIERE